MNNSNMALPVGIEKLYVALLTTDAEKSLVHGTPKYYPDIQKISMKQNINKDKLYTEGRLKRNESTFDSIDAGITIASLTSAQQAELLGRTIAAAGGVYSGQEDKAPFVAILYKAPIDGGYRYGVLYKGQFSPYDEELAQKEGKTTYAAPVLAATFQSTDYVTSGGKHLIEYHVDTTDPNCPADIDDTWFASVTVPEADKTAPTVTAVPADSATSVAADSNVVWTFSKAIDTSTVTASNFMLLNASTGDTAAGTLSVDGTGKIVTLNPTENMTAGATMIAIATTNVHDLAGNKMAVNNVTNFTVAS